MCMLNVPNVISLLRLALAPALVFLAWQGESTLYLCLLAGSLISDFVDGFLARYLRQMSELGAKLDSWADLATYATVPVAAWWLLPGVIHSEAPFVIVAVACYLGSIVVGFCKFGRLTSYHTWGAKLSTWLIGGSVVLIFAGGPTWPFRIAAIVLVLTQVEEFAITMILPEWRANVPSFWHARKAARHSNKFNHPPSPINH
jgi:CDP-diacylglycerol--glycerol-3-phosphate 3-phosphatidyltransferase